MKILHSIIKGEGRPLIILHGFLGMADNWKTLGNRFSENGFRIHLTDQRNHGRSFHDDTFNYKVMVADLHRYILHHQLKEVALMGHSMGGKTAMLFAATYPELVSRLIIVDMGTKYYPQQHQRTLMGLKSLDFNTINSRGEADRQLVPHIPDLATRQLMLKNLYWTPEKKLAFRFHIDALIKNAEAVGEAFPEELQYQGETLFLKGGKSAYITEEDWANIKMQFPNAVIDEVQGAGHWPHAEQPVAFFSKVMSFLRS